MVQWQNATFPRLRHGFDSRYPLNSIPFARSQEKQSSGSDKKDYALLEWGGGSLGKEKEVGQTSEFNDQGTCCCASF